MTIPEPRFTLRTLGTLHLERWTASGVEAEPVIRGGKPLALLAYLCIEGRRGIQREVLADLLWGAETPETSRGSLRQAIFILRRAIGDDALVTDRMQVALSPDVVAIDTALFARAESAEDVDEVLRTYRGPFLGQVPISGAPAFERWSDAVRDRLSNRFGALLSRVLGDLVRSGALDRAAGLARLAIAVEPTLEELAVSVSDVLVNAGRMDEARDVLEAFRGDQARQEHAVSTAVTKRLERIDRVSRTRVRSGGAEPSAVLPGEEFSGRATELAVLFRACDVARAGGAARIALVGPPGIGKSRLLDEFEGRLRARGTRVARVRFVPALRKIPASALGEMVRVLASLPGALGVSQTTTTVLVALLPELRRRYPIAESRVLPLEVLPRLLADAVADLLEALGDERVFTLLLDDVHNADDESARIIDIVLERRVPRLLTVEASRQDPLRGQMVDDVIRLLPFSRDEIVALVGGPDSEGRGNGPLVSQLMSATGGIPRIVLEELRHHAAQGALLLRDGTWQLSDSARTLGKVRPLKERIRELPPAEWRALLTLSLWRRPMSEDDLILLVRDSGADWRRVLLSLESQGYVALRNDEWTVAHDLVADACIEGGTSAESAETLRAFARLALPSGNAALSRVDHLMQAFGAHGQTEAAVILCRAANRHSAVQEAGLRGRELVTHLVGASGRAEWGPEFQRAIGRFSMLRPWHQQVVVGASIVVLLSGFWIAWMLQPRLVVEAVPMAIAAGGDGAKDVDISFVVQPRVGIYNGFGRFLKLPNATVSVSPSRGRIVGDAYRSITEGRAQFERLAVIDSRERLEDGSALTLRFASRWWIRSIDVQPSGQSWLAPDRLRLIRAVVDGDTIAPTDTAIISPAGDSVNITITYEFTTTQALANYVVGATPDWGDARTSAVRLAGLPRPVHAAWQTVSFRVARPLEPGPHHVIIVMAAEGGVEHLLSQTNWSAGEPVWGDGNDIANLPPAKRERLSRDGLVATEGILVGRYRANLGRIWAGDSSMIPLPTGATGLRSSEVTGGVVALWVASR